MYLKQNINKELTLWKREKNCRPLLLRGARQIGKIRIIRNLGKQFDYYIEINFESNKKFT